jgi:hypothetical protein
MEENGRFSLSYNRVEDLTNCIKSSTIDRNVGDKLILFVPLKCEKYYLNNQMDEVKLRIKEVYSQLFAYFSSDFIKKYFTVAITPILTVGDVVFDDFGRDESKNIAVNRVPGSEYMRPKLVYYKYANDSPKFSPKFCEQPVLYILSFISSFAKKHGRYKPTSFGIKILGISLGIFGITFFELANRIAQDFTFQNSVKEVKKFLKRDQDGYEIAQNPLSI